MRALSTIGALAVFAASACSSHPATQVLVELHADAALRAAGTSIRVRVAGPDGTTVFEATNDVGRAGSSLARVPLVPAGGDASRTFAVEAELLDAGGAVLARVLAQSGYVKDELRELHLWFEEACGALTDCGPGRTCDRGVCLGACYDALPVGATDRSTPTCGECAECIGATCASVADGSACGCAGTDQCNAGACITAAAVTSASSGHLHTCAATRERGLYCWGSNRVGQLGSPGGSSATPRLVDLGALSEGTAATDHTCWLQFTGDRHCWGWNGNGQLGTGTEEDAAFDTPVAGPPGEPGYSSIDTGWFFSCALGEDGRILCWGGNDRGECAVDPALAPTVPDPVAVNGDTDWVSVAAGGFHACGVKQDGRLFCWGMNENGELGVGDSTNRFTPVQTGCHDGTCFDDWVSVAAGDFHTCAIRDGGELWCWGGGLNGQLGVGTIMDIDSTRPLRVEAPPGRFRAIAGGSSHTCAIAHDETLWCWGRNDNGQLGLGDLERRSVPARVRAPGGDRWLKLAVGREHTCAVRSDETLWCWGWNEDGQLGLGAATPVGEPSPASPGRVCFPP